MSGGVNIPHKQMDVKKFLGMKSVRLVSLLETKVKAYQKVFVGWCFCSNSFHHKGGRIVLVWNCRSFGVNITTMSSQMTHCLVKPFSGGNVFSFIYASMMLLKGRLRGMF